jgi:curved DNA-binding protein CbpA
MLKKNTTLKKHYKVLELSEGAELTEIKASYKKLALQFHPDKNPDGLEKVIKKL